MPDYIPIQIKRVSATLAHHVSNDTGGNAARVTIALQVCPHLRRSVTGNSSLSLRLLELTVTKYLFVTDRKLILTNCVSAVSFNGIHNTVFDLFDNTGVVTVAVQAVIFPIKKDNVSGTRCRRTGQPLILRPEPISAIVNDCVPRHQSGIKISALIGAPAYKNTALFYSGREAVLPAHFKTFLSVSTETATFFNAAPTEKLMVNHSPSQKNTD